MPVWDSRTFSLNMARVCVKLGLFICSIVLVTLLCFYYVVPTAAVVERLHMQKYDGLSVSQPFYPILQVSPIIKDKLSFEKLPEKLPARPNELPDKLTKTLPNNTDKPSEKLPEKTLDKVSDKLKSPGMSPERKTRSPSTPPRIKIPVVELPQSVIDRIKTFVFFVGHGSSGHSIVGSLLDSHPHMVVSHEFTVFQKLSSGSVAPTRSAIFNALWKFDINTRSRAVNEKGYTLLVNGLYEGRYIDHIDVIGDKRGDCTIRLFIDHPDKWSSVYNVLQSLNVTVKVIHVIRNPYDNIASRLFLNDHQKHKAYKKIKHANNTYTFQSSYIAQWVNRYFQYHQGIVNLRENYNLDVLEVHGKDLILDPSGTLMKLCNHLGVTCSSDYLKLCSNKIYKSESRPRLLVNWTKQQLERIQQNINKYRCLQGYDFDSM